MRPLTPDLNNKKAKLRMTLPVYGVKQIKIDYSGYGDTVVVED